MSAVACSYCGALDGQPCVDRRGRPPIWTGSPDTVCQREVYDHYAGRTIPFNPRPKK